jgi:transcriptional regulator GlxA family with amidase domain
MIPPIRVDVLLFPGFELLDVAGPAELLYLAGGRFELLFAAAQPGPVASAQGVELVATHRLETDAEAGILLVPGGIGTRREVDNTPLLDWLRRAAARTEIVASVCTGSALLAAAGVLDGRRATSNKIAFDWAAAQGPRVEWVRRARWVEDGKFLTSSGISAGMDMTLALIARVAGRDAALEAAQRAEYRWNEIAGEDPFAPA